MSIRNQFNKLIARPAEPISDRERWRRAVVRDGNNDWSGQAIDRNAGSGASPSSPVRAANPSRAPTERGRPERPAKPDGEVTIQVRLDAKTFAALLQADDRSLEGTVRRLIKLEAHRRRHAPKPPGSKQR